jgi:hypothetical protein
VPGLARRLEVDEIDPRLGREMVGDVAPAGRARSGRRSPFITCAGEARTREQPHPARVVDVEMRHDHALHLAWLDTEVAQLFVVRLGGRLQVAEDEGDAAPKSLRRLWLASG